MLALLDRRGHMPDPDAAAPASARLLAGLGSLLGPLLWPLPIAWCAYSTMTLWTLHAPAAALPALTAATALLAVFARRRRHRANPARASRETRAEPPHRHADRPEDSP